MAPRDPQTTVRLTVEELNRIDDALAYYALSGYGGGDHDNPEDRRTYRRIDLRISAARRRLGEVVD